MQGRAIPGTLCFPGTSLTAVLPPISLPADCPAVFSPESQIPGDFIDDSEVLTKKRLAETPAASNWIHRRPMHFYKPTIRKFVLVWTQHVPVPPKKTHLVPGGLPAVAAFSLDFFPAFGILPSSFRPALYRSNQKGFARFDASRPHAIRRCRGVRFRSHSSLHGDTACLIPYRPPIHQLHAFTPHDLQRSDLRNTLSRRPCHDRSCRQNSATTP